MGLGELRIQPVRLGGLRLRLLEIAGAGPKEEIAPEIRLREARMRERVIGIESGRALETADRLVEMLAAPPGPALPELVRGRYKSRHFPHTPETHVIVRVARKATAAHRNAHLAQNPGASAGTAAY